MPTDTFVFAFYARRGQGGAFRAKLAFQLTKSRGIIVFRTSVIVNRVEFSRVRINLDNSSLTGKNSLIDEMKFSLHI